MSRNFPVDSVIEWFLENRRDLPWRSTEDPYEIWVAEIMLQQTQVGTVLGYYDDFLDEFPTVEALADATQDDVLKAWEGMGFYARARRLHAAAQEVVEEYGGELPCGEDELKSLPGIGEYTAAAIGAFAFNRDSPVVDSNVERVIARWNNIDNPIGRRDTQARIEAHLAEALELTDEPGLLSEGIMELGALVCTARNPDCDECPLIDDCLAYEENTVGRVPVTKDSDEKPHHEIAVGVVEDDGRILIARRPEDKMLGGLWEFPGGKQEDGESMEEAVRRELREELGIAVGIEGKIDTVPHEYSHLSINLHAYWCHLEDGNPSSREGQNWEWVPRCELDDYAFPKANKTILKQVQNSSRPENHTTGKETANDV